MKRRRVVIIAELKSATPLKLLKQDVRGSLERLPEGVEVLQVRCRLFKTDAAMRKERCRGEY